MRKQANDNCERNMSNSAIAAPFRSTQRPSSPAEVASLSNGAVTTAVGAALRSGPRTPKTVHREQPALKREHRMSIALSITDRVRAGTGTTPAGAMTAPAATALMTAAAHAAGTQKPTKSSINARCKPRSTTSLPIWPGSPVPGKYGFDRSSTTIPVPNGTLASAKLAVDGAAEAEVKRGVTRHVATTKAWQELASSSQPQLWTDRDPATGIASNGSQVKNWILFRQRGPPVLPFLSARIRRRMLAR